MADPILNAAIVPVTRFRQNCTVLWCTRTRAAALVDPGGDLPRLESVLAEQGLTLSKVFLTHGHLDHAGAANAARGSGACPSKGRIETTLPEWRWAAVKCTNVNVKNRTYSGDTFYYFFTNERTCRSQHFPASPQHDLGSIFCRYDARRSRRVAILPWWLRRHGSGHAV